MSVIDRKIARVEGSRLNELQRQLREIDTMIEQCRVERLRIRQLIEAEHQRIEALVVAHLDAGMTAPEVAAQVGLTPPEVHRLVHAWRQRNEVTVRRGRAKRRR